MNHWLILEECFSLAGCIAAAMEMISQLALMCFALNTSFAIVSSIGATIDSLEVSSRIICNTTTIHQIKNPKQIAANLYILQNHCLTIHKTHSIVVLLQEVDSHLSCTSAYMIK